jgi:hypothetical protein
LKRQFQSIGITVLAFRSPRTRTDPPKGSDACFAWLAGLIGCFFVATLSARGRTADPVWLRLRRGLEDLGFRERARNLLSDKSLKIGQMGLQ